LICGSPKLSPQKTIRVALTLYLASCHQSVPQYGLPTYLCRRPAWCLRAPFGAPPEMQYGAWGSDLL